METKVFLISSALRNLVMSRTELLQVADAVARDEQVALRLAADLAHDVGEPDVLPAGEPPEHLVLSVDHVPVALDFMGFCRKSLQGD